MKFSFEFKVSNLDKRREDPVELNKIVKSFYIINLTGAVENQ